MTYRMLCAWGLLTLGSTALHAQDFVDLEVQEADYLLQPPAAPPERPSPPPRAIRRSALRQYASLDRMPNMYGDLLGGLFQIRSIDSETFFQSQLPMGAGRSYKITENNRPIPTDRLYFNYNHFHNALANQQSANIPGGIAFGDGNVDRYTLGLEKTFFDGNASIDMRMPFVSSFSATDNVSYDISSGNVGDFSAFYKQLLYADDMVALAAGLGLGLPTGDDVDFRLSGESLTLHNDAVHLMPYVGAAIVPNDFWFFQSYLQIDFAASGNELRDDSQNFTYGQLTEQHLFHASLSGGYWLYDNPEAYYIEGVAALLEVHYTTTIQDADTVPIGRQGFFGEIGNEFNRVDFLNLTTGLHFQIGPLSNLRIGCAVPLRSSGENRQFDAETQVQFNRFF